MSLNCSIIVVHRSFSKPGIRKSKRLDFNERQNKTNRTTELFQIVLLLNEKR